LAEVRVAGLDDAGRGSIIGPLVIGGVCVYEDELKKISEIGVRDSKLLSPAGRARLYNLIRSVADRVAVRKIPPEEIDEFVFKGRKYRRLNYLEALAMGRLASELEADVIYVDSSDIDPERFSEAVRSAISRDVKIFSAHHADRIYPVVSAASIVAKIHRDREVAKLAQRYGDLGSGYPSDPRTISFLREWIRAHGELPSFSRRSWKTWRRIRDDRLIS